VEPGKILEALTRANADIEEF